MNRQRKLDFELIVKEESYRGAVRVMGAMYRCREMDKALIAPITLTAHVQEHKS